MNWRRGFWRVWGVISIVWIAVAFVIAAPFPSTNPVVRFDAWGHQVKLPADTEKETVRSALIKFLNEERAKDPGPWIEYQGNIDEKVDELIRNYQPTSWFWQLLPFSMIALLPPAILLVLGMALGWIVRGFRTAPS